MRYAEWSAKLVGEVAPQLPEPLELRHTRIRLNSRRFTAIKIKCLPLQKKFAWIAAGQVHWRACIVGALPQHKTWQEAALAAITQESLPKAEAAGDMALVMKLEAIAERIRQSMGKPKGGDCNGSLSTVLVTVQE